MGRFFVCHDFPSVVGARIPHAVKVFGV
jgi:hypothetical protein